MSDADDRIQAVTSKIAEREHLVEVKKLLADDVAAETQRVTQLAKELQFERADVERMTTGVMGFLEHILADKDALAKEQREVVEAQARLGEAQGSLDMLRAQAADVDARLAQLVPAELDKELAAARNAREAALMVGGGAVGAELQDIAIRIESIDIELVPLGEAVGAGEAAFGAVRAILAALDAAAARSFDELTKSAKALAGAAQAKLIVFRRALASVATASFADPLDVDPGDTMFADDWVKALFAKRTPQERLQAARASMITRIERITALLTPLRARRDELATRRKALVEQRTKLVG